MVWLGGFHAEQNTWRASDHLFWAMAAKDRSHSRTICGFHWPDDFCDSERSRYRGPGARSASAHRAAEAVVGLPRSREGLSSGRHRRKRDLLALEASASAY